MRSLPIFRPSSAPAPVTDWCEFHFRPNTGQRYVRFLLRGKGYKLAAAALAAILLWSTPIFWMLLLQVHAPLAFHFLSSAVSVSIGVKGIEIKRWAYGRAQRFEWSQVQWLPGIGRELHLCLGGRWLRLELDSLTAGNLLPTILAERCAQAELPHSQIELIVAVKGDEYLKIPLELLGNRLRSGTTVLDLHEPLTAAREIDGGLTLRQSEKSITIHPHDPRLAHIVSLPRVARAIAAIEKSTPKGRWLG